MYFIDFAIKCLKKEISLIYLRIQGMMLNKIKLSYLFFFQLVLFSQTSTATHIAGGEMNYRFLGGTLYEVTLTVYRDCYNGIPDFDNPAVIGIYDGDDQLLSTTNAFITTSGPVANAINSPCLVPPTNVCYEVANYVFNINLPPAVGGYTITYQRCCRNSTVINVQNVDDAGATYFATIPDPSISTFNSNPKFINLPPTFICMGVPFTFDHSAIDYEGDSLVYSVCAPFHGGSRFDPVPDPPAGPPYSRVVFRNPYSVANALGGTPLVIDPFTGLLKATPNSLGQFIYGITVKEYRNGVLLGETTRDFQVNVVSCPEITVASIFSPTISCGTLSASFENTSYNAATYHWDFGETGITSDTSSLMNPTYAYADTGDYVATLIAYSGINPDCNDTAKGMVHIYPVFNSDFDIRNEHCSNRFEFLDRSYGIGGVANFWKWDFGDDSLSYDIDPVHLYSQPGTYIVSLITSADSSCYDTLKQSVVVQQNPVSDFVVELDTCSYSIKIIDESLFTDSYRWDFGDGNVDYTSDPVHSFSSHGSYSVQQIVFTDSTCIDTSEIIITIPPLASVDFNYNVATCDSVVSFTNLSSNAKDYLWNFGDGVSSDFSNPVHTYSLSGTIPVTLTGISIYGCETVFKKDINFVSFKEAEFSAVQDSCSGNFVFSNVTANAVTYNWNFGDGTVSGSNHPVHNYGTTGKFEVLLIVNKESVCSDSMTLDLLPEELLGEILFLPNSFTPNGDGLNDYFQFSTYRPCLTYSIQIFNRWGTKIYENDNAGEMEWDGKFQDQMVPADIYVYILNNGEQQRSGMINVIR